jgi:hypothetical protein
MPTYIPNEILNIIFSYVERPKHSKIMKYLIEDCYEEDYNPFFAETWRDNYCFEYSFAEWYYLYRIHSRLGGIPSRFKIKKNIYKYKHTPNILLIGSDKLSLMFKS